MIQEYLPSSGSSGAAAGRIAAPDPSRVANGISCRGSAATAGRIASTHPCFSGDRPHATGRIHLPVAPACNIGCRFCERSCNATQQRPGVSSAVLTPEEACKVVARALELQPELAVAGIAGPGDTLANNASMRTFALIKERFPHLLRCLSTNGLLLAERIDELVAVGVDTLTITVNDVEPERLALINSHVVYHGRLYRGREAAQLLIERQLAGLRAAAAQGLLIKVNTVLIPTINGEYISEIARAVARAGAGLYNLIPLIPHAQMADIPAPSCAQIERARASAEEHIAVFRHCQHCRADAIGIPGGPDITEQVYAIRGSSGTPRATRPLAANTFSHG